MKLIKIKTVETATNWVKHKDKLTLKTWYKTWDKQVDKHEEIKTETDHYNCVFENSLAKQFFKVL